MEYLCIYRLFVAYLLPIYSLYFPLYLRVNSLSPSLNKKYVFNMVVLRYRFIYFDI